MLYLWHGTECPNKHIAVYDRDQSPDRFLLMRGNKLNLTEFSRCYVCVRSLLDDLNDDFFVRTRLRHDYMYTYIFTADEMFCCAGGIVQKIKIPSEVIKKLKIALSLTDSDINNEPKILSDAQLNIIYAVVAYPQFSRTPRLHLPVTISMIEKKYDSIINNASSPLVNQKIRDILLKLAPDDVQFIKAEVHCKDGILTNYNLVNVTSEIIGVDREKSIYTMMKLAPDVFSSFRYLTYKTGCMGNHKLARDAENLGNILVTEEIKLAFEKEKIKGVWFISPEKYHTNRYGD
ncbi:MAG: hypothetical protein Q8M03_11260 [Legionella sp.]|nr:hypothetical protein [Legionella sp.]